MESQISRLIEELVETPSPKETIQQLDALQVERHGITQKDLTSLIGLITDPYSKLSLSLKKHMIKHFLLFKGKVHTDVVYRIVGSLGTKTDTLKILPHKLQISLIQWLLSVHTYLQQPDILDRLYGLLFNYLEFEYLRAPIAQLLLTTTKKKHITEARVNHLISTYTKDITSEPIIALAIQYQQFKPELMLNVFPKSNKKFALHNNKEYVEQLRQVQQLSHGDIASIQKRQLDELGNMLKKRRISSIAQNYATSKDITHVSQNVSTLDQLVSGLETLTIPKDWDSLFTDPSRLSLLSFALLHKDNQQQFRQWIQMSLDGFQTLKYNAQKEFLDMLVQYVELTGDVDTLLVEELLTNEHILLNYPEWNVYVWFFISRLELKQIDELMIINNLYNGLFSHMPVEWCSDYLYTLGALLKNWYNSPGLSEDDRLKLSALFKSTLRPLAQKFKETRHNCLLMIAVSTFISQLQLVPESSLEVQDVVLPATLVYNLLFCDDPVVFSSLCAHLNFAKSIIKSGESTPEILEFTNLHNSYVVDICNLTWRNKAFDTSKTSPSSFGLSSEFINSFTTTLPIFDRHSNFKSLFNIHHAPTFAAYSARIVRSLEDQDTECTTRHEGPLTTTSMKELIEDPDSKWLKMDTEDVKVHVLKELELLGYIGLADLLFSHLKSLVGKR